MRHNPQEIVSALELYFRGLSLRNTQKTLRMNGIQVSHKTIYYWIKKYVALMNEYAEKIQPELSEVWRADEVYVKIKGDQKYLFALMDDETRYWIAQEVADSKYIHDARGLFIHGKEVAGKTPTRLITDGLPAYRRAFNQEFRDKLNPKGKEHIKEIALRGTIHNNKMERMNGEIRDREKTMRGLKVKDTPILKGMQVYHNFFREHEALNGKTPSEACGIEINGGNKWETFIQNASINHQPQGNTKKNLEDFV